MTGVTLRALFSHWRRAPLQLLTLLGGLALATALWSGVQAINSEARASYHAAAATLGEGRFDQIRRRDGQPLSDETYVTLRRSGWLVSPVVEGRLGPTRLVGLDPLTAPGGLGPVSLGDEVGLEAFLSGQGALFGRSDALASLAAMDVELIVAPEVAPGTVIGDIGLVQRLLGREGEIDRLLVAPSQPLGRLALDQVAPQTQRQAAQGGSDIGRLTDSFHLNLTAFGLLSFAVGIFIVNSAIGLAFEQRRPMIRTLRALGVPMRRLTVLLVAELALFAALGGSIGVALGYGIAAVLMPDVAATLRGLYGAEVAGTLALRPEWWVSGLGIAMGGTALAGFGALWQIARMPILAGGHARALTLASRTRAIWLGAVAAVLLLAAAVLAVMADGLVAGFAFLACLLVGGALALPVLLDGLLRLAERRARGPVNGWFWADSRQQLPGLSLALMALLLAVAANVGVATMVSSFRATFTEFLDQRLASELYLTAETQAQAREVEDYLTQQGFAVLPLMSVPVDLRGLPSEVYAARDHATYRENWQMLQASTDPWDAVHAGDAVLINEQLARRTDLSVGQSLEIAGQSLRIAGIYGDYGNPLGQVILTEPAFRTAYPEVPALRFGVRVDYAAVPALVAALEADFGLPAGNTINQAAIKGFSLEVFERTFTVTAALNVLTLAVAGFAILMSLLTLAAMRVPQLAPVWAMGLTRARLGRMELLRAIVLAGLTVVLALPLGLVLAWALLAIVNVAAFGWKLPMFLFPIDYLRLTVLAVLAAAAAATWPAWRLSRTPPADLLKVFANER